MENIKLAPVDKFHLEQLVSAIEYLKNSDSAKKWLSENNHKLLLEILKFDEIIS